jgi:hypothetical protein
MNALFDAIVPESWIACSWNVSSLGEWIAGLMQRHEQLSRWIHARPKSIWMTGLFNPAALLIGICTDLVQHARVDVGLFGQRSSDRAIHLQDMQGAGSWSISLLCDRLPLLFLHPISTPFLHSFVFDSIKARCVSSKRKARLVYGAAGPCNFDRRQ